MQRHLSHISEMCGRMKYEVILLRKFYGFLMMKRMSA